MASLGARQSSVNAEMRVLPRAVLHC